MRCIAQRDALRAGGARPEAQRRRVLTGSQRIVAEPDGRHTGRGRTAAHRHRPALRCARQVADGNRVIARTDRLHAHRRAVDAGRLRIDADGRRSVAHRMRPRAKGRGRHALRRRQVAQRGGVRLRGARPDADRDRRDAAGGRAAIRVVLRMRTGMEQREIRGRHQHGEPPERRGRGRACANRGRSFDVTLRRATRRRNALAARPIKLRSRNPGSQCFVPDRLERLVHLVFPRFSCAG